MQLFIRIQYAKQCDTEIRPSQFKGQRVRGFWHNYNHDSDNNDENGVKNFSHS